MLALKGAAIKLLSKLTRSRKLLQTGAVLTAAGFLGACTANLPAPGGATPAATPLLPPISGANSTVIAGKPRTIYERIARQATRCWFGPFGSLHTQYMMHADVPPPASSAPVTMAIHRRLPSRTKPWGPALVRVQISGTSTTTLEYKNVGLASEIYDGMTTAFTRWANGRQDCPVLHGADPRWAPQAASPVLAPTSDQR